MHRVFRSFALTSRSIRLKTQVRCFASKPPDDKPWRRMPREADAKPSSPKNLFDKEMDHLRSLPLNKVEYIPRRVDIIIIGGGLMGQAMAYFLKYYNKALDCVVVEKDTSYKRAQTALSIAGVRQQFTTAENIYLSQFTTEFLRDKKKYLSIEDSDDSHLDIPFHPTGYLYLANDKQAEQLRRNYEFQIDHGAQVNFLSANQLKKKMPFLNVDDIEAGVLGMENEGYVDQWALMGALKKKNLSMGVKYLDGSFVDFLIDESVTGERRTHCALVNVNGTEWLHPIEFHSTIVASGAWSPSVMKSLDVGAKAGIMSKALPVEPRKRYVYAVHCPSGPQLNCPLIADTSGSYVRREGYNGMYLMGKSPNEMNEPPVIDYEVDYDFFENEVWPDIAHRVPCFEEAKLKSAWAGYYDYNFLDQNLVTGPHPYWNNLYFACGLSGHGFQHSLGIGRAVAEYLQYGKYKSIDLERFHFARCYDHKKLVFESCVI